MSPGNLMFQSHLAMTGDGSASCMPGIREVQLSSQILAILENIEPEMAYSGFDNTQLDLPHVLLNSLNRLCEMQLLWIVRWSKSLPGNCAYPTLPALPWPSLRIPHSGQGHPQSVA
jgi:progesterone receptor